MLACIRREDSYDTDAAIFGDEVNQVRMAPESCLVERRTARVDFKLTAVGSLGVQAYLRKVATC